MDLAKSVKKLYNISVINKFNKKNKNINIRRKPKRRNHYEKICL